MRQHGPRRRSKDPSSLFQSTPNLAPRPECLSWVATPAGDIGAPYRCRSHGMGGRNRRVAVYCGYPRQARLLRCHFKPGRRRCGCCNGFACELPTQCTQIPRYRGVMSDWQGIDVRENTVRMEAAGDDSRCELPARLAHATSAVNCTTIRAAVSAVLDIERPFTASPTFAGSPLEPLRHQINLARLFTRGLRLPDGHL